MIQYLHTTITAIAISNGAIDGDTIKMTWRDDTGKYYIARHVRLLNINTPEITKAKCKKERIIGKRAKYITNKLLEDAEIIELQYSTRNKDSFGRVLATVYIDGKHLGDVLRCNGVAQPYIKGSKLKHDWCGDKPLQLPKCK